MRESFYHYLMTLRDPNNHDPVTQFANDAFFDTAFPKQTDNFATLTKYLEENGNYLQSMTVFDEAWQIYQEAKR